MDIGLSLAELNERLSTLENSIQKGINITSTTNNIILSSSIGEGTTAGESIQKTLQTIYTNIQDGKTNIANAMGSPSVSTGTFAQLASDITTQKANLATNLNTLAISAASTESLKSLVDKLKKDTNLTPDNIRNNVTIYGVKGNMAQGQGNATESNVLYPYTFTNSDGTLRTGAITDYAQQGDTEVPATHAVCTSDQIIKLTPQQGYYSGTVSSSASLYEIEPDFRADYFPSNINLFNIQGTMPSYSNDTWAKSATVDGASIVRFYPPAGYYDGTVAVKADAYNSAGDGAGNYTFAGQLGSSHIVAGYTILGVTGTGGSGGGAPSGYQKKTGSNTATGAGTVLNVTNLGFTPSVVYGIQTVYSSSGSNYTYYVTALSSSSYSHSVRTNDLMGFIGSNVSDILIVSGGFKMTVGSSSASMSFSWTAYE